MISTGMQPFWILEHHRIINTVKVRIAVDAWLDTQCGVPEITVSPDECSYEDSSKVYRPLQRQIQGAIP